MSFWRFGFLVAAAHAQQCVTKQLISPGDGVTFPKPGDTVSMQYTGTLASTGAKFDSSLDRGKDFSTQIGVGQVIKGWDQGVPQMSLGEHATLRISAACGYGATGSPPVIPPNADLVFDVTLDGINGRLAAAPTVASFARIASAPTAAPPTVSASGPLPRCIKSSCGNAISFDTTGAGRPLCLCNPLCQQWATTPGILPCCPGLQEVCLDPYRQPGQDPTPAPVATAPAVAPASFPARAPASFPAAAPASFPAAFPAPKPASFAATASFGASTASTGVAPASFSTISSTPVLPTCRPNSCGKGMASGVNSNVAICACDVSCYSPTSSLPCCTSFREVCQANAAGTTSASLSGSASVSASASAPVSQSQPMTQAQFNAQFGAAPMQQMSATLPASASIPSASTQAQSTQLSASSPASSSVSSSTSSGSGWSSPDCALGKTKWAEQTNCDKKRYAIQNGKCNKVCPSVDPNSGIKYWPTGQPGKDACSAALAICKN